MMPLRAVAFDAVVDIVAEALEGSGTEPVGFFLSLSGIAEIEESCEVIINAAQRVVAKMEDRFISASVTSSFGVDNFDTHWSGFRGQENCDSFLQGSRRIHKRDNHTDYPTTNQGQAQMKQCFVESPASRPRRSLISFRPRSTEEETVEGQRKRIGIFVIAYNAVK